jgi:NitT/TauT family transport system substrate-binding protein
MAVALRRREALALVAAFAAVPSGAGAQTIPIRLGAGLDDGLTPVLFAMRDGIFKRLGLDVSITSSSNGAALAAAVAGGSVDIAKSALMSLLAAYAHSVRFKIVAGGTIYDPKAPTDELVVLTGSPIRSAGDLSDKTIAVATLQSLDQMAIQADIDQHGGRSSGVRFIELQYSAMPAALRQGRADAASIANPALQNVLESGQVRSLGAPYSSLGSGFLEAAWFCSDDFVAKHPGVARRFGEAVREAAAYTNTHHDETALLLADYAKMDPAVIKKMKRDTIAVGPPTATSIQPCIDAAYKYGYIAARFAAKALLIS